MNENEVGSSLEAGTRDQPPRTSAWEASLDAVCVQTDKSLIWKLRGCRLRNLPEKFMHGKNSKESIIHYKEVVTDALVTAHCTITFTFKKATS